MGKMAATRVIKARSTFRSQAFRFRWRIDSLYRKNDIKRNHGDFFFMMIRSASIYM